MPTLPFDLTEYARDATGEELTEMFGESPPRTRSAEFGPSRVPRQNVSREELLSFKLDHKAGFLVSLVDGVSTIEMIVDVAGMPKDEALALLHELYLRGVIRFF